MFPLRHEMYAKVNACIVCLKWHTVTYIHGEQFTMRCQSLTHPSIHRILRVCTHHGSRNHSPQTNIVSTASSWIGPLDMSTSSYGFPTTMTRMRAKWFGLPTIALPFNISTDPITHTIHLDFQLLRHQLAWY